jgi:hypothetical protein
MFSFSFFTTIFLAVTGYSYYKICNTVICSRSFQAMAAKAEPSVVQLAAVAAVSTIFCF